MANYKKQKAPKVIYTKQEEEWLVKNVLMYSSIIENKKTDSATNHDKDQAWEKITNAFNIAPPAKERTLKSLREKYMKIKQSLRDRVLIFSRDSKKTGPHKMELPILSQAMQELSALVATSALGLAAKSGESDFSKSNSSASQTASTKFSPSGAKFQDKKEEEKNNINEVTFDLTDEEPYIQVKTEQCSSEEMVQPAQSSEIAEREIIADEAALVNRSRERVNSLKLRKPLNKLLQTNRRKRNTEQRMYEENLELSIKKHKIEIEILSSEKERYQFERERAAIECERADLERERAAIELQRAKDQLRFEKEIHQIRLATLQSETGNNNIHKTTSIKKETFIRK